MSSALNITLITQPPIRGLSTLLPKSADHSDHRVDHLDLMAVNPVPRQSKASQQVKRVRWVFTLKAVQDVVGEDPLDDEDREAEAQFLVAQLDPACEKFAFQLETAPTTGYLHYQGTLSAFSFPLLASESSFQLSETFG